MKWNNLLSESDDKLRGVEREIIKDFYSEALWSRLIAEIMRLTVEHTTSERLMIEIVDQMLEAAGPTVGNHRARAIVKKFIRPHFIQLGFIHSAVKVEHRSDRQQTWYDITRISNIDGDREVGGKIKDMRRRDIAVARFLLQNERVWGRMPRKSLVLDQIGYDCARYVVFCDVGDSDEVAISLWPHLARDYDEDNEEDAENYAGSMLAEDSVVYSVEALTVARQTHRYGRDYTTIYGEEIRIV